MEVNLAYLAGLIDADGCISLNKVDKGRYAPCLSFVNTSKELIDLFQSTLGGIIRLKKHKDPQKPTYEIQVRQADELAEALNKVIPFLIYKRKKAELIELYTHSIINNEGRKLSQTTKNLRWEYRQMWEELNGS